MEKKRNVVELLNARNPFLSDPYEQIKAAYSIVNENIDVEIGRDELAEGAREFERFWLRPRSRAGRIVPLRMRINRKYGGWRLKDELVEALGLTVGDCITTEVTVCLGRGVIDDDGETDLFAEGDCAEWLVSTTEKYGSPDGCIIDCFAMLSYCKAPVGGLREKEIYKVSIILLSGIRFVKYDVTETTC